MPFSDWEITSDASGSSVDVLNPLDLCVEGNWGKYFPRKLISGGESFNVFQGELVKYAGDTSEKVSIKLEEDYEFCKHKTLGFEVEIYDVLRGEIGVPKLYESMEHSAGFSVLILELLGPSLHDLFESCGRSFSLCTVLNLAIQMIDRIQTIHEKNIVHRDISPHNFLVGVGKSADLVYIIDFDQSKKVDGGYWARADYRWRSKVSRFIGTERFAPINAHKRRAQSRGDDLEALGYVLVYFLRGGVLPWSNIQRLDRSRRRKWIRARKEGLSVAELCKDLPEELALYTRYVRSLQYADEPDYDYLRALFRDLLDEEGFEEGAKFDWEPSDEEGGEEPSQGEERKEGTGIEDDNKEAVKSEGPEMGEPEKAESDDFVKMEI